jgi:hypothetical protein
MSNFWHPGQTLGCAGDARGGGRAHRQRATGRVAEWTACAACAVRRSAAASPPHQRLPDAEICAGGGVARRHAPPSARDMRNRRRCGRKRRNAESAACIEMGPGDGRRSTCSGTCVSPRPIRAVKRSTRDPTKSPALSPPPPPSAQPVAQLQFASNTMCSRLMRSFFTTTH